MDFQSLLLQIGELEETNRNERSKLNEETVRHRSTQGELEKSQIENGKLGAKVQEVKEKLACLQVQNESNEKTISQLKSALKSAKQDSALMKEACEKDMKNFQSKREEFTQILQEINQEWRNMNVEWRKGKMIGNEEVSNVLQQLLPMDISVNVSQINLPLPQKTCLVQEDTPMVVDEASIKKLEEAEKERDSLKEEVEGLRKKKEEMEAKLKESESYMETMRIEFGTLDEYDKNLQIHFDQLNSILTAPQSCPSCGNKFNISQENP